MILKGTYLKTLFRNHKTGYTAFLLHGAPGTEDEEGNIVHPCCGVIPYYAEGVPLSLDGQYFSKNGQAYFRFLSAETNIHDDTVLLPFLRAYLPAGMGQVCAEQVAVAIKESNLSPEEFLKEENTVDVLTKRVRGMKKKDAVAYVNKLTTAMEELSLLHKLSPHGINYSQIHTLFVRYGTGAWEQVCTHPYSCMCGEGIPFSCADSFAKSMGRDYFDEERIRELIYVTYQRLDANGESYGDITMMMDIFRKAESQCSCFQEKIPKALAVLELLSNDAGHINAERDIRFYTASSWQAEEDIVRHLNRMKKGEHPLANKEDIQAFLQEQGGKLDCMQKKAVEMLDKSDPVFLIGGPGSGKTTTIKQVYDSYKQCFPDGRIAICAPTGRAAERIREATGCDSTTIHMLLEYKIDDGVGRPNRNQNNPLELDFLIVDEFSMVGIYLFSHLLDALPATVKLMLVGDWNQLQPVEPGFLLHDLVESGKFRYVELTGTHRQEKDSLVVINREKILQGDVRLVQGQDCEIYRFPAGQEAEAEKKLLSLCKQYYSPNKIQDCLIVTPRRGGNVGADRLSSGIQSVFHQKTEPHIIYGNGMFYAGDRVMTIKNRYGKKKGQQYFNGDLWLSEGEQDGKLVLSADGKDLLTLDGEGLEDAILAYVMTVHKCQGSEGDTVIIFLPESVPEKMISRSLLYTAATRPKKKLIIISVAGMMERFICAPMHTNRHNDMSEKLKKLME